MAPHLHGGGGDDDDEEKQPLLINSEGTAATTSTTTSTTPSTTPTDAEETKPDAATPATHTLRKWQIAAFAAFQLGMSFTFSVQATWLAYEYVPAADSGAPTLVHPAVYSLTLLFARVLNGLLEPWIGYLSDRLRSRFGRRKPVIFVAAPVTALTFALVWFMPLEPMSAGATAWFIIIVFLNNFASACVMAAYIALLPEVSNDKKDRITISASIGVASLIGNVLVACVGPVNAALPNGVAILGLTFSGLQIMCCSMAGVVILLSWLAIAAVDEQPVLSEQVTTFSLLHEVRIAFGNPAFRTYIVALACTMMPISMWGSSLPYLCTVVLETENGIVKPGTGEAWVGIVTAITLVIALLVTPVVSWLARRFGKKRILLIGTVGTGIAFIATWCIQYLPDPAVGMIVISVAVSFCFAAVSSLPNAIYADVVEQDELATGKRREGVYTGVRLLCMRTATGLSSFLIMPILSIGSSESDYLGIMLVSLIGGVIILFGSAVFTQHPISQ